MRGTFENGTLHEILDNAFNYIKPAREITNLDLRGSDFDIADSDRLFEKIKFDNPNRAVIVVNTNISNKRLIPCITDALDDCRKNNIFDNGELVKNLL